MARKGNYKHGYFGTPTYKSWGEMIYRCKKEGKKYWHDKGIKVCDKWLRFEGFLEDMGERPLDKSLDRINSMLGYYKKNCQWSSRKEQGINRVDTNLFEFRGQRHTFTDWAEILHIKRSTLAQRFYVYKWSIEKVLAKGGQFGTQTND